MLHLHNETFTQSVQPNTDDLQAYKSYNIYFYLLLNLHERNELSSYKFLIEF